MATYAENLETARDNAAATLASILAAPKPTYNIDGQLVSWTDYQRMLIESIDKLNNLINGATPYEEHSIGYT